MKFINPRTDYAFKKIFGSKWSHDILISFLNAMLEFEWENEITEVTILDPYQAPKIEWLKDTYLDVKVLTQWWKEIIIEMQVLNVEWFDKRVLYNLTKSYSTQIEKWTHYLQLKPVIALTITDFLMFDSLPQEKYLSRFIFQEKEEKIIYNGDLEMVFIELPKFKKQLKDLVTIQDKWIYFMKEVDDLQVEPEEFSHNTAFSHAFDIASTINISKEELDILEHQDIYLQDKRGMVSFAQKKWYADWLWQWIEQWIQKWIEKWIEKWIKKWIEKGVAKWMELALQKMIDWGMDKKEAEKILFSQ